MGPDNALNAFQEMTANLLHHWRRQSETRDQTVIQALFAEKGNLHQVILMGLAQAPLWSEAVALLLALFPFVDHHGLGAEWLPLLEQALTHCPAGADQERIWLLNRLGQLCRQQETLPGRQRALELHQQALELAQALELPFEVAHCHYQLAVDQLLSANLSQAQQHAATAQQGYAALTVSSWHLGSLYNLLGLIAQRQSDWTTAAAHFGQAESSFSEVQDSHELARVINNQAQLALAKRDFAQAIQRFEQALELSDNPIDRIRMQLNLGAAYYACDQFAAAEAAFRGVDQSWLRQTANHYLLATVAQNLGNVLVAQEDGAGAEPYLREAIRLWQSLAEAESLANSMGTLGECLVLQGDEKQGQASFRETVQLLKSLPPSRRQERLLLRYEALIK